MIHHTIVTWIEESAETLRQSLTRTIKVDEKTSSSDLVTEMDKAIEASFVALIEREFPDHRILGEEGIANNVTNLDGYVWIIDPIDGTLNFVKQKNNFGIMLALYYNGEPIVGYIYDVMKHNLYVGIMGEGVFLNGEPLVPIQVTGLDQSLIIGNINMFANNPSTHNVLEKSLGARAHGSAALEIIAVIRGEASAYISLGLSPWDFAAGHIICSAMGLNVSQVNGEPLNPLVRSSIVFAHESAYDEVIALLNA